MTTAFFVAFALVEGAARNSLTAIGGMESQVRLFDSSKAFANFISY
jgi:hypothetical protein